MSPCADRGRRPVTKNDKKTTSWCKCLAQWRGIAMELRAGFFLAPVFFFNTTGQGQGEAFRNEGLWGCKPARRSGQYTRARPLRITMIIITHTMPLQTGEMAQKSHIQIPLSMPAARCSRSLLVCVVAGRELNHPPQVIHNHVSPYPDPAPSEPAHLAAVRSVHGPLPSP